MHEVNQFVSRSWRCALTALAVLTTPSALYAQSCAMCYQTAANSGTQFIQALRDGILILLFPSLLIGAAIAITAYRKRDQCAEDQESAAEEDAALRVAAANTFSDSLQSSALCDLQNFQRARMQ